MRPAEDLAATIRELRAQLFFLTEHREAHERVWETEEEEAAREESNREARAAWDADTERLIGG